MKSSNPTTAEDKFRQAFERLKQGAPEILPLGTPVSQNNVAKEAGCDATALRKSRFPDLVAEIQRYVASRVEERSYSERQHLLKRRQQSRDDRQIIIELKAQRDAVQVLQLESNARISILTHRVRDLEARLADLQPKAKILPLPSAKRKVPPLHAMDRLDDN